MKKAILIKITGGEDHASMIEDRCDNLMDHRACWNYSFQLEGREEPYCIAIENVERTAPENKILTPARIAQLQLTKFRFGRKKWWSTLMDALPQPSREQFTDKDTIWRFIGSAHCWAPQNFGKTIIFGEYDARERCGYILAIADGFASDFARLKAEFPQATYEFAISNEDEQTLCHKW